MYCILYNIMSFINYLQKFDKTKKLIFIHTPKCGGSYVCSILNYLNIQNKGHNQSSSKENGITFTVIRNPIDRFESLLNYRLGEKTPRNDWPKHLKYVYKNKNITLNEIVSNMSDEQILGFSPYKTLRYWTKNVDIIITIDQLSQMLKYFNYNYDVNLFKQKNVSRKIRGKLNEETINRLKKLYNDDLNLFNNIIK